MATLILRRLCLVHYECGKARKIENVLIVLMTNMETTIVYLSFKEHLVFQHLNDELS